MKQSEDAVWDVSLSTMWAMENFSGLENFFAAARGMGFARQELNHQVNSTMLAGIDLNRYTISSIHEPCPADISMETLKARDWVISAVDEGNRRQGVLSVKRSIDMAGGLGVKTLVVHPGNVDADRALEKELRTLYKRGQAGSSQYLDVKGRLMAARTARSGPRLVAVQRSLVELLEYAAPYHVCLGLENRYHFLDIPSLDEMKTLLDLAASDQLGFWYDVGHAHALDRLGFFPHEEWLKRYAGRIVGVHLHDTLGITDHDIPGNGEVDFERIAPYLPTAAIHTLEVRPGSTPEQVKDGLRHLAHKGCIRRLPL